MSDYLDEAEKWLPSELLTEEDIVMDSYGVLNSSSSRLHFTPDTISNYFNSFSSSSSASTGLTTYPFDSIFCSTKTDQSDEDDLLAILLCANQKKKGLMLPVSPSSTLSPAGIWSGWSNGLIKLNPNGVLEASSRKFGGNDDVWSLIQQARMLEINNAGGCGSAFLGPQRSFTTPPPPPKSTFFHSHQLKQEDYRSSSSMKNVWAGSGSRVGVPDGGFKLNCYTGAESGLHVGLKDQLVHEEFGARSGLNSGDGYGFGAGFGSYVGVGGLKSGARVGTGVFLPREYGTKVSSKAYVDSRNKLEGSSTWRSSKDILARKNNNPSGVTSGSAQPRFGGGMINDNDAFLATKAARLTLLKNRST